MQSLIEITASVGITFGTFFLAMGFWELVSRQKTASQPQTPHSVRR